MWSVKTFAHFFYNTHGIVYTCAYDYFASHVSACDVGMTPLHQAVVDGNDDAVRLLVSNGCDINRQDTDTWTPLHTACACGHAEIVRYV